jgi:Ca2+-binding RTX toxin-like protein
MPARDKASGNHSPGDLNTGNRKASPDMATTTINGTNGRFVTGANEYAFSDTTETLIVTSDGFLISTGIAAGAVRLGNIGRWKVDIQGTVFSKEAAGILLESVNFETAVFKFTDDARVSGVTGLDLRSSATLTNAGTISGSTNAIVLSSGEDFSITNSGSILGNIVASLAPAQTKITNSGLIDGAITLNDLSNTLIVTAAGRVTGNILMSGGADVLENAGLLGQVSTGSDADKVKNSGTIASLVTGAGNDTVTNTGSIGSVDLGDGNDTYTGGGGADTVGDSNGGDTIKLGGGDDVYRATGAAANLDEDDTIEAGGGGGDIYDASAATSSVYVNLDNVVHDTTPFGAPASPFVSAKTAIGVDVAGFNSVDSITGFENVVGGSGADTIYGSASANRIEGGDSGDYLFGFGGKDEIAGGAGDDWINGGAGADRLFGGAGADRFQYLSVSESGPAAAAQDVVGDFDALDIIDLSLIDADKKTPGDQTFDFIGTNVNFTKVAGELRSVWTAEGQLVQGDVNGDGKADFAIRLYDPAHAITLSAGDFLL